MAAGDANSKPIQIAVTGGKGGTGKTTVALNLSLLFSRDFKTLILDYDVENPNALILSGIEQSKITFSRKVYQFIPVFKGDKCVRCGACVNACSSNALLLPREGPPTLFENLCEGCRACKLVCPTDAIEDGRKLIGEMYRVPLTDSLELLWAEIVPGFEKSGYMAMHLRRLEKTVSREGFEILIVDTAPGAHCDVLRALMGRDIALLVTEPTPFGEHDLKLIIDLVKLIELESYIIINRSNIGDTSGIYSIADEKGIKVIGEIPFDEEVFKSHVHSKPMVLHYPDSSFTKALTEIYGKLKKIIGDRLK